MTISRCLIAATLVMVFLNPVHPGSRPQGLDGGPTTSPAPSSHWTPHGTPSGTPSTPVGSHVVTPAAPSSTARPDPGAGSPSTIKPNPTTPPQHVTPLTPTKPSVPLAKPSPQSPSQPGKMSSPQENSFTKQQIQDYFKKEREQFSKQNPNLKPDQNLKDYYDYHDSLRATFIAKNLPSGLSDKAKQDYISRVLDPGKQDRYNTWRSEVSRTSGVNTGPINIPNWPNPFEIPPGKYWDYIKNALGIR
jgi:hypothetical protein